jgi:hypothetical protein
MSASFTCTLSVYINKVKNWGSTQRHAVLMLPVLKEQQRTILRHQPPTSGSFFNAKNVKEVAVMTQLAATSSSSSSSSTQ